MGGQLNGFEMRLKPSASREGASSENEERVRIYSREKLESTLCKKITSVCFICSLKGLNLQLGLKVVSMARK